MHFLSIFTGAQAPGGPPSQQHMDEMNALMEKMSKSGNLIFAGGIAPSDQGFKISQSNGASKTTDGPFTDVFAKGTGFALMKANSKEELIPLMKEFLKVAGDGECEVMPVFGAE